MIREIRQSLHLDSGRVRRVRAVGFVLPGFCRAPLRVSPLPTLSLFAHSAPPPVTRLEFDLRMIPYSHPI